MTADDFANVARELSCSLPAAYCEALMRPEFRGESAGFQEFVADADEIIGLNLEARREGFYGSKWPDHFLVIGDDGAGNYYFTDLRKSRPAVLLADHEHTINQKRLATSETYDSFADFIAFVQRLLAEDALPPAIEETAAKPAAKARWWKPGQA